MGLYLRRCGAHDRARNRNQRRQGDHGGADRRTGRQALGQGHGAKADRLYLGRTCGTAQAGRLGRYHPLRQSPEQPDRDDDRGRPPLQARRQRRCRLFGCAELRALRIRGLSVRSRPGDQRHYVRFGRFVHAARPYPGFLFQRRLLRMVRRYGRCQIPGGLSRLGRRFRHG